MPYTEESYGEDVQTLEGAPWYRTKELGPVIRFLKGINFSVVTQREQARERLNDLRSECPYSLQDRFPAGVTYVCALKGDWPRKFTQVQEALCFKETTDNPASTSTGKANFSMKNQVLSNPGEKITPMEWDYNMAERAYFTGLEQMEVELGKNDRVFGRKTFESEFGLAMA